MPSTRPALRAAAVLGAGALALAAACDRKPPIPGYFTRADIYALADDNDGAETRVQLMYHYFKKDHDPSIKTPAWLDRSLPAMLKRGVWQDPDDGVLNEAQLWQAPMAVLYEFYELTRGTFPPEYGGRLARASDLADQYRDSAAKMAMAVSRLRKARLEGSLDGRGRGALDVLDKIVLETDGLSSALAAKDESRFKPAVLAVAARTQDLFKVFANRPR